MLPRAWRQRPRRWRVEPARGAIRPVTVLTGLWRRRAAGSSRPAHTPCSLTASQVPPDSSSRPPTISGRSPVQTRWRRWTAAPRPHRGWLRRSTACRRRPETPRRGGTREVTLPSARDGARPGPSPLHPRGGPGLPFPHANPTPMSMVVALGLGALLVLPALPASAKSISAPNLKALTNTIDNAKKLTYEAQYTSVSDGQSSRP